uniref:SAGA-associated factor 11 n=1 Tax=Rhodnius prolixus TaxID=13249 RepID=T1HNZ7_RHOPR
MRVWRRGYERFLPCALQPTSPFGILVCMSSHYNDLQEYSKTKLRTFQEEVKSKFLTDESYADHASHMVVDQLVDEIVLEVVAEYHRAVVKGYADHVYPTNVEEQHKSDALNREIELSSDIIEKKIEDIKCPNCTHPINASRFVPHLEKCMCIGRSSSRIASRRIATNSKDSNYLAAGDSLGSQHKRAPVSTM